MKDNFSAIAKKYQSFRPTYPDELYEFLLELVSEKNSAWDCGTGNGQIARELARHFKKVYATDISRQQLDQAPAHHRIMYSIQQAEEPAFPDNYFDLITVAQAIHWFRFDLFYKEVERTMKPSGIFAVIGYGLIQTFPEADEIISRFYRDITGPYWDEERKYLDNKYQTIPFPFRELESPEFTSTFKWDFEHLIGYLNTWSAVKHYQDQKEQNPVDLIYEELKMCWDDKVITVNFPVFTRIAKIEK